jgi:hypothetical protein
VVRRKKNIAGIKSNAAVLRRSADSSRPDAVRRLDVTQRSLRERLDRRSLGGPIAASAVSCRYDDAASEAAQLRREIQHAKQECEVLRKVLATLQGA